MTRAAGIRSASFRLLLVASVIGIGGYAMLLPVVPLWAARGGSGTFGAGASTGVFMLVTVLTQLAVPWVLRRVGHGWAQAVGLVLLGGPAPLFALSPGLAPVLALSAVRGVGFGLVTVVGVALVAELTPPAERGRASALQGMAVGLPQLAWMPVGVGMVDAFGFELVFLLAAAPVLAALLVPFIRVRPGAGRPAEPSAGAARPEQRSESSLRGTVGPVLAMLACAVAQGGLITFLPLAIGGAGLVVPLALFGTTGGVLVGRLVAGELVDRRGLGGRLLGPGVLIALVGMLAEVCAAGAGTAVLVIAGATVVGIGFGLVQNDSLVAMFAAAGPARYGAASALWNIAYDGGTGMGAVGLGAVAEPFGFRAAFGVAALALALVAPAAFRRRRSGRAHNRKAV
ncbi:MFS transporter [Pseudonocardia acaciae]|uniref:MFS transporter n=1 Tax=Pseudonocardia acaciae TaxID=551276 RepID=UPI000491C1E5|nr:MFS transporter [Pseudonocardia acaciae]